MRHQGSEYQNSQGKYPERPQCMSIGDKYTCKRRDQQRRQMDLVWTDNNYRDVQDAVAYYDSRSPSDTRYFNPYEYGSRQNELGPLRDLEYMGRCKLNRSTLQGMGLSEVDYDEQFPGAIRNVNLESSLLQRELTHGPGQRGLTGMEINRFELLPFDPQDTRHIVWRDNMPRGGYPSRSDRLEII